MDLTKSQQELADLLFSTKTHAKVRRRKQNPDGSFEFFHITRDTAPFDFRKDSGEFVAKHHEINPSAPLLPMYINLRSLPEEIINKIAEVMCEVKLGDKPDVSTGIPNAAVPYAKKFSELMEIPYVTIFDKDDNPAKHKLIENSDAPKGNGKSILLVDDLITKGASKLEAINIAQNLGYKVAGLLVLIDREEGGSKAMKEMGFKLYSAFKLSQLLNYYLESGKISKDQFEEVEKYLEASKHV